MLSNIFEIRDETPVITTESINIPIFKKIWERDKTKNKTKAAQIYAYIYHCYDPRSVYSNLQRDVRLDIVAEEYMGDVNYKPDELVLNAIEKYKQLISTPEIRAMQAATIMVDKLSNFFRTVDFSEKDDKGQYVNKTTDAVRNLKDLGNVMKSLEELRKQVEKGLAQSKSNNRGNQELNMFDK